MSANYGDLIVCGYTNWQGKVSKRGFIYLESFFGKNEYHRVEQLLHVGYDIDKREIRTFSDSGIHDGTVKVVERNRAIAYRTNWYEIVNGKSEFHHQAKYKDLNMLHPTVIDDKYGVQSKWSKSFWEKVNLYYIDGIYVGRLKIC